MGVPPLPWVMARAERSPIVSPEGVELRVAYNDGGAAHSGRYWMWLVRYSVVTGWREVAGGYVEAYEREGEPSMLKVEWPAPGKVRVWCAREKRGGVGWVEGEY